MTLAVWALFAPHRRSSPPPKQTKRRRMGRRLAAMFVSSGWPFLTLKLLLVILFLLVIIAGLYGTPIPARNIATVLTWNIWWSGLIFSVFFLGSAWCAVCPWDTLATWLTRFNFTARPNPGSSLNLRVPKLLRNVWPALLLFTGLTWMELGVGITTSPYATALLSMLMLILATISLALFERKAFCRYFCPVGRTIGFYAQLAPVELRHIDAEICNRCVTLDCYHGNEEIEPCPTNLVMKNLQENTYCTSCGNCIRSCPDQNIAWRPRPMSREALQDARPRPDEAWFMLGLLALTGLHGLTMMPFWERWIRELARLTGDSGQLLWSFTAGLLASIMLVVLVYGLLIALTRFYNRREVSFKRLFFGMSFIALPLAFAYHLAHNLNHLLREGRGLAALFMNPLGLGVQPLSMAEKQTRAMSAIIPQDAIFALQTALIVFGFWIAMQVLRHRGEALLPDSGWKLFPMCIFALIMTASHLWLLAQPMMMRF
ncbi:MAG: 4Fe-4S binding protein [Gammaproteobacteria bacterium]|nr:MAG: 4Fe-4S binding protein [Gammaproteobacteria bacterium]